MEQPEFLSWEIVLALHEISLARWSGLEGVRDRAGIESALGAAENTFLYGYGDIREIAAAYAFHLAENQGFLDGNKRTAAACAAAFLEGNGCRDEAHDDELYDAIIAIAKRQLDKRGLAEILRRQFPRPALVRLVRGGTE